jgi:hypothetical protein
MPKLDGTHIVERLRRRLAELNEGKEVARRDLVALLTAEQVATMDAAWERQQQLRATRRARNDAEATALGQKSKRDIHIEAVESALSEAADAELAAWARKTRDAEIRQARIHFDTLTSELAAGTDKAVATNRANNALTQAGLQRLDGSAVRTKSKRDAEVVEVERQIRERIEAELTDAEREQLELLREHDKLAGTFGKKHS